MKIIILLGLFICFGLTNAFSQIKPFTEEQYNTAQHEYQEKVSKIPRRVITITDSFSNNQLITNETLTQEYTSSDVSRWEFVTKKTEFSLKKRN